MAVNVDKLRILLDTNSIDYVWKNILATHAATFSKQTSEIFFNQPEFKNMKPYDEDILSNLTIGEIGILYEFSLAYVNKESRKQSGQYFTPDDVSQFLISQTKKFPEGIWLDPCSGVGNLSYWLTASQPDPEKFLVNNLKLTDKDPLALLIAKNILFLHFYKTDNNLLKSLSKNVTKVDFLTGKIPTHDYVIANPPYAQTVENHMFETYKTRDLYAYFLERIIKTSKGFVSITPQSFTNSNKFDTLRKLIVGKYNNITVMCFDNIPDSIFKGIKYGSTNTNTANSTRAAIIVAQTGSKHKHQITPLLRWKTSERSTMFSKIDNQLSETVFDEKLWLKQYKNLLPLYKEAHAWKPLKDFLATGKTEYEITIPTTPRYFISATLRNLTRSSYTKIYFNDKETRDIIYLLLNSSIPYWWWRLNDGGMTLSKETIYTIPVPKFLKFSNKLYTELKQSEVNNLVTKMNAGKLNENVKHSKELIKKLNSLYVDETTANKLMKLHSNTDFS